MGIFGWSYPPGAENDPNAPYNQVDDECSYCGLDTDECTCEFCRHCGNLEDSCSCEDKDGYPHSNKEEDDDPSDD